MDFGEALAILLDGGMVRRRAWGGRWVVLQRGYPEGIPVNAQTAEVIREPEGTVRRFRRYLLTAHQDGTLGPWDISQEDVLADDWEPHA